MAWSFLYLLYSLLLLRPEFSYWENMIFPYVPQDLAGNITSASAYWGPVKDGMSEGTITTISDTETIIYQMKYIKLNDGSVSEQGFTSPDTKLTLYHAKCGTDCAVTLSCDPNAALSNTIKDHFTVECKKPVKDSSIEDCLNAINSFSKNVEALYPLDY